MVYLLVFDTKIGFRVKDFFMNTKSLLHEYIRISIPVLISDGILAIGTNSVAMVIGHLDEAFITANSITSVTQQLSTVVITGVSQAGAIVTGITLGEGDRDKTMRQGYQFFRLGLLLGSLSAAFIYSLFYLFLLFLCLTQKLCRWKKTSVRKFFSQSSCLLYTLLIETLILADPALSYSCFLNSCGVKFLY